MYWYRLYTKQDAVILIVWNLLLIFFVKKNRKTDTAESTYFPTSKLTVHTQLNNVFLN